MLLFDSMRYIQSPHSQTLRLDNSFCWRHDKRWTFSNRKKWKFDSRKSSDHSKAGDTLQTPLNNCCTQQKFPRTSQNLSSHFLTPLIGHSGDVNFLLLCQSSHFLAWAIFKGLFMSSWVITLLLSWSRTTF